MLLPFHVHRRKNARFFGKKADFRIKNAIFALKMTKSLDIPLRGDKRRLLMEDNRKYGAERERTIKLYNMQLCQDLKFTTDKWQMPIIESDNFIPSDLISFNYALTTNRRDCGIHFYLDDYQFERIWHEPERYIERLKKFQCILTPDFSLYRDMIIPQQIYNIYRSRLIGAYYQKQGIKVIPTISWSDSASFEYCFKGIPKNSIVSISTVGVMRNKLSLWFFKRGVKEMIKQIEPKAIIIYGNEIEVDFDGIKVIYYNNKNSDWRR